MEISNFLENQESIELNRIKQDTEQQLNSNNNDDYEMENDDMEMDY